MTEYALLAHGASSGNVTVPDITTYRELYICIIDSTNGIILSADTINSNLLYTLGQSGVFDYVTFYQGATAYATLLTKAVSKTSLTLNLDYGSTYPAGRLSYYVYGVK